MKVSIKIQGANQLAARLRELPQAVSRKVQIEALTAGAELIRAEAARMAPRSAGPGPHLADNIVTSAPSVAQLEKRGRFDEAVVEVGPSRKPSDHFYGFFQEFGTKHHGAQPFMRPAFDSQSGAALNRVLSAFWLAIRRFLPSSSSNVGSRAA